MNPPKKPRKKVRRVRAWAVLFSKEIIETTTMFDNGIVFQPLAIFSKPTEAVKWRKEKWMGPSDLTLIKQVEIRIPL